MRLRHRVLEAIERHRLWSAGDAVVVACSGGRDSVVLLDVLTQTRHAHGGALAVLTVDHGVRAESAADASFVVALAEERGLPHRVVRATAAGDDEAALRAVRQEAFDEAVAAGAVVATAHHREDQAETVLLQLLRSTGTAGRRGMRWASHGRVRPLLGTPAASVAAWAEARELSWREDPTNRHPHYLRNRVRHELLPLLESLRGGATASLARSAAHAAEDDALLERLAAEALTMNQLGDGVRTSFIAEGPPALTRRALRARWPELGARVVDAVLDAARRGRGVVAVDAHRAIIVRPTSLQLEER